MNPYLKNLNKIEFVVTYACTGKCRHCSEGEHSACGEYISPDVAAEAVRKVASSYDIRLQKLATLTQWAGEYHSAIAEYHCEAIELAAGEYNCGTWSTAGATKVAFYFRSHNCVEQHFYLW